MLRDFATFKKPQNNMFFFKKEGIHKYTRARRRLWFIIDYMIVNTKVAGQFRSIRRQDIGCDHFIIGSTIDKKWKKKKAVIQLSGRGAISQSILVKWIELSIRNLYQTKLNRQLGLLETLEKGGKLKQAVINVACKVLIPPEE